MTRDDIIRMALEAGISNSVAEYYWIELGRMIAAEREECAKVCEDIDREYDGEDVLATWCAQAIRARGQS